jgi:hypothetical protein
MNRNGLLNKIVIGSMKSLEYPEAGYKIKVNDVKFFSPFSCFNSYILGLGDNKYKIEIGDNRYNQIKRWIQEHVMPYLNTHGNKQCSSYGLKHFIQDSIGGYVSNETVKVIMCELGANKKRVMHGEEYPLNLFYSYDGVMGVEKYEKYRGVIKP